MGGWTGSTRHGTIASCQARNQRRMRCSPLNVNTSYVRMPVARRGETGQRCRKRMVDPPRLRWLQQCGMEGGHGLDKVVDPVTPRPAHGTGVLVGGFCILDRVCLVASCCIQCVLVGPGGLYAWKHGISAANVALSAALVDSLAPGENVLVS